MPRLTVWMVRAALLQLGLGVTLGLLLLSSKGGLLDARVWLLLGSHIELMVFGWLMQLALGVAYWILPRFTHEPRYGSTRLGWVGFVLMNIGVVLILVSNWIPDLPALHPIGRLVELVAALALVRVLWPRVKAFGA